MSRVQQDVARPTTLRKVLPSVGGLVSDPLARNGLALVVNTLFNALLGLAFWVLAGNLFSSTAIGEGAAIVSLVVLLAGIAQLNIDKGLLRFLPTAGPNTRMMLVRSYCAVVLAAVLVGIATVLMAARFGFQSNVVPADMLGRALLVVGVVAWSLFAMQDAALSAMRLAHWVPIENASFGLLKVGILVLAWATVAGRSGETLALVFIGPVVLFVAVVNLVLFRRALPAGPTEGVAERAAAPTFRDLRRFSTRDFLGSAATQLLQYGLPLVVAARLGAAANGNFYKAYVVVMSLDLLAMNLTTSMMVEGAHDSSRLGEFARRTALIVAVIVGLAALATALGAPVILSAFGADDATLVLVLRLLAIAVVARACTTLAVGIWRVQHRLRLASGAQVAVCAAVLVSAGLFAGHGGLPAVAGAVAAAHLVCAVVLVVVARRTLRTLAPTSTESSAVPA